jgi:hypothetical protein
LELEGFLASDISLSPPHGTGTAGIAGTTFYRPIGFDVNISYFTAMVPHSGLQFEGLEYYYLFRQIDNWFYRIY